MAEQKIVEITRQILVKEKGYPDPANCEKPDSNNLIMYAQDDYKKNPELYNKIDTGLLNHSSKCADKNLVNDIWTNKVNGGKPEFIITNETNNLAIVIECKPASKNNNHISPFLRDENVLMGRGDIISKYAVDGALHYAKFLAKKYNVIAVGISGVPDSENIKVSTYYWEKDKETFYGEKELIKKIVNKETKLKEECKEKLKYCYGPFVNLKLDSLQSYNFYIDFLNRKSKQIIKEFNEEKAISAATELNVILDGAGVNTTTRALLVSGLLLALRDKTFQTTYENKEISSKALQDNLHTAIERVVDGEDIQDSFKKKVLKDKFNDSFNQQDLLDKNAEKLRLVLEKLHTTVYPCMNGEYSIDIIGKFYHEFLSYAPNSQNNGIKLTPSQITSLFCELVDLKVTDTILDPCLGTGGFLIAAMNKLYQLADNLDEDGINNFFSSKLENDDITQKQINRIKSDNKSLYGNHCLTITDVKQFIRKNQLVGCEADNIMYTLGCSNMILRGDGKSNILLGDCFKRDTELKGYEATVGMMNPPYSGSAYSILQFVELLCRCVKPTNRVAVIVPTSAAHSDDNLDMRNNILKNNTLLGVMSMSLELFKGIADTIPCIMIFKAGVPHDFSKNVYFGNWKEDGYYWHSSKGMIPDYNHIHYPKTPDEYMDKWLKSFNNDDHKDDDIGCWRKLTLSENNICYDEWLWEYFVETDYSKLTQEDFEKVVKDYIIFNVKQLELSNIKTSLEMTDGGDE
jgi:hypothetical protein